MRRAPGVLLVDATEEASILEAELQAAGFACRRAADAELAWRLFAQAPPDAVFTRLNTPRRDAGWLLRRMHEEYLGSLPPVYGLVTAGEIVADAAALRALALDAVLLLPAVPRLPRLPRDLRPLVAPVAEESAAAGAARVGELFELSLLSGDLDAAQKVIVERVARAFRASDCLLRQASDDPGEPTGDAVELAGLLGGTLIVSDSGGTRSYLAAALDVPGGGALGTLAVVAPGTRRFLTEERHTLRALARRLGLELAWRSAHERLVSEHDRMRQSAILDPLCGVLARGAFDDALAAEILRATATSEPVTVAVLDVEKLRAINDRFGHEAGDSALAQLADAVRSGLRPTDVIGRVGGDELGIVLPGAGAREAHELLEALVRTVSETRFFHLEIPLAIRIRVGLTAVESDRGPVPVLQRALAAAEIARQTGAAIHYSPPDDPSGDSMTESISPISVEIGDVLMPGSTLGGMYQVLHEISRGAMGVVYRAEDMGLRRPVAVKVLRPEYARNAELVARFRNEAAMLAAVRHENLVQVYSFGAQEESVFFVMELVEGESLSELLVRLDAAGEAVAPELVERVVVQVAGALDGLHRAGAVHRDVKPANILLDRVRDRAVLVDVGVARREEASAEAAGTPGFGAPESFMKGEEGPGTDVYGLAATVYMLLTNLAPFGGGDVGRVIRRQLNEEPAAVSLLRPGVHPSVDRVLARALKPLLRDRYANAVEFAAELAAALRQRGDSEVSGLHAVPPEGPAARGAIFRIAYRILGNRLGSAWVRTACARHPELHDVLRPTVGSLSWYSVDHLRTLLAEVPASVRDPRRVARELGRASMSVSFVRFYGLEPEVLLSLTPGAVLADAPRFWARFHAWGRLAVSAGGSDAVVTLTDTPRDALLCCLVEGSLERIVELCGGLAVRVLHPTCESQGAPACTFDIRWNAGASLPEPLPIRDVSS